MSLNNNMSDAGRYYIATETHFIVLITTKWITLENVIKNLNIVFLINGKNCIIKKKTKKYYNGTNWYTYG